MLVDELGREQGALKHFHVHFVNDREGGEHGEGGVTERNTCAAQGQAAC